MVRRLSIPVLCLAVSAAAAETITVGPGSKFDFTQINQAIKAASDNDVILVAPGTYAELVDPRGKRITIESTAGAAKTVIDGQHTRRCLVCTSGETLGTIIRGFTLQNGMSPASAPGGGIVIVDSSPRIEACRVSFNTSGTRGQYYTESGAGVAVMRGYPRFEACLFQGNATLGLGGGAYLAGKSVVDFVECQFESNEARKGGGIYVSEHSAALLSDCILRNNVAEWYGGGVYLLDQCELDLGDCEVTGNAAGLGGGGVYGQCGDVTISGGVFELNAATAGGGINMNCGTAVIHETAFQNNDGLAGGDIRVAYTGDPPGTPLATVIVSASTFCGSVEPIEGPWTDAGKNAFFGSCADGACCSNGMCAQTDADTCTLLGGTFQGVGVLCEDAGCPGDCPADISGDGIVGADDILKVISDWGPCP
ncbi:MAG: right-handed parallel beta-helix repeat-containing protein [Phycisphaerales bacterium]|jgi:hypothetical protein|nr:right-handed parallel beta-helix repeat-containing protein [Phycisphaerales bacterium]